MLPPRTPCLVLIQRKVLTPGQWSDNVSWVPNREVWVSIDPVRGREIYSAGEREAEVTHKIRGDFLELEGIDSEDRVIYNDTHEYDAHGIRADSLVFDILAVLPNYDGRDDILFNANLNPKHFGDLVADVTT
jgi:SPP1 family predicted phage head-tail adaptor